jgi:hypothetical protein
MNNLVTGTDLIIISSHPYGSEEVRTTSVMNDLAEKKRVYFFEAPVIGVTPSATYFIQKESNGVILVKPYLPKDISVFEHKAMLLNLLKELIHDEHLTHYTLWTDTPKAMPFIRNLSAEIIVYDCLNDYSYSNNELEKELLLYADVVLTNAIHKNPYQAYKDLGVYHASKIDHSTMKFSPSFS